jgi:hypothetical protein
MPKSISKGLRIFALLWACQTPSLALAGTWVVEPGAFGVGYIVTDHDPHNGTISTNNLRTAKRVARILNKATSGFYDPGSGPCHNPKPGTQC